MNIKSISFPVEEDISLHPNNRILQIVYLTYLRIIIVVPLTIVLILTVGCVVPTSQPSKVVAYSVQIVDAGV